MINITELTPFIQQPNISIFGIIQIEARFNSFFVLDGDGTIHVLGENSEGALGIGNLSDLTTCSKVGSGGCQGGILTNVAYISTMSTNDNRISSSANLVDRETRSWGSNSRQSITTGEDMLISYPIAPTENNRHAVVISNGAHITPYIKMHLQCIVKNNKSTLAFLRFTTDLNSRTKYNIMLGKKEVMTRFIRYRSGGSYIRQVYKPAF